MNDTLKSSKFYQQNLEQEQAWNLAQEQHLLVLEAEQSKVDAEDRKREQMIFLGFFSVGLVATLLISGAI